MPALFYATRDDQARRVAERIADRLSTHGFDLRPRNVAEHTTAKGLPDGGPVVLVAAVRYGHHLPEAERFLAAYGKQGLPLVLLSVNLTARKSGKQSATGNRYVSAAITRFRLAPLLAAAIAGRLDYPRYGWLDRQIIRLIMALTGGPTDPRGCTEFTDWSAVDALADQIAQLAARMRSD